MSLVFSSTKLRFLGGAQAVKPPELNPETEDSLPSCHQLEGPDPPVLTEVSPAPPSEFPPDLESVKKKMDQGRYSSVVGLVFVMLSLVRVTVINALKLK